MAYPQKKGECAMANEIEGQSLEGKKSNEGSEKKESQKLDDATFEPHASVEETGDFRQAETIQNHLVQLMDNTKPATAEQPGTHKDGAGAVQSTVRPPAEQTNSSKEGSENKPSALRLPTQAINVERLVQQARHAIGMGSSGALAGAGAGISNAGQGTSSAGSLAGSSGSSDSSGASTNLSGHGYGTEKDQSAGGESADDINQEIMDFAKEAYDKGDTPESEGKDVSGWVAGKAAEYFAGKVGGDPQADKLIELLKDLSNHGNEIKTGPAVTRVSNGESENEPGSGDGGNSDEPGTSGGSKAGTSNGGGDNQDDDSDDDDDDDSDDDGSDAGDTGQEPGEQDPGGDEPGAADGEDDSGHGHGIILKDGGSSGGGGEQDDSGHKIGLAGGKSGSGGSSGGGDDSGDDSGHPGGKFGGGVGKILSDNQPGAVDPIGPTNTSDIGGDKLNTGNLKNQTGKM
jgi:hypothetical protein